MANTLLVRMSARILDELGVQSHCTSYALVDPTASFDTVTTTYNAWLAALDNVTAGQIVGAEYAVIPALPTLKSAPNAGSRTSQTAVLSFTAPPTPRRDSIAIPGVDSSLVVNNNILVSTGFVNDFITFITAGASSVSFATSDGESPVSFKDALLSFRKYTQQLHNTSLVLA